MMRTNGSLAFVAALVAFASACGGVEPDERSGRDAARGGAQEFPLDRAVTDAVNFEGGDATDWKVFEIERSGTYTLELYWDYQYVESVVNVHDQYGTLLQTINHDRTRSYDIVELDLPESGLYYLRIRSDKYRTTYSLRVTEGRIDASGEPQREPREEPLPEFDRPI